ncbi:hypothetical protein ANAEL_04663 [Anaerolineales bacterium]|nr:hypothetical protein ANAEL_04663 [Anaerolineales bacterium]
MVVTSEKTHTEYYRDRLTRPASVVEPARPPSEAADNFSQPDFATPAIEPFGLKLTNKLTAWLRKQAD